MGSQVKSRHLRTYGVVTREKKTEITLLHP